MRLSVLGAVCGAASGARGTLGCGAEGSTGATVGGAGTSVLTCVVIAELAGVTFCTIRGVASGIGAVGVATALTGVGRWITCPWVDCVSNSCMP